MGSSVFILNDRFVINSERSEILDKETGLKDRLEPRLMKLLCMLAEQHGKVVKRELIIKEIWDDYPGANEGLNQAISFLRKLLADEDKAIIQTQPKSGYSFHAVISRESVHKPLLERKYIPVIIATSVLVLLLFLIVNIYLRKNASETTNGQLNGKKAAEISRLHSTHQAKQMQLYFKKDTMGKAAKGDSLRQRDTIQQ